MPEPTPSQLKIDGILIVPEGTTAKDFKEYLNDILKESFYKCSFEGTISPLNPDAESFMVEIERTVLGGYKKEIQTLYDLREKDQAREIKNMHEFANLAEQLRQEKEQLEAYKEVNEIRKETIAIQRRSIEKAEQIIAALELRLKVKDSPIKAGLKRIWKWFKGLVGK